jgi:hypothetical protein
MDFNVAPVKLDNPLDVQQKILTIRQLMAQGDQQQAALDKANRAASEQQTMNDIFRAGLNGDGTPNHTAIIQGMASQGVGHMIPGYRKSMLDADKDQSDINYKSAQTDETKFKTAKSRLDASGGVIASLLQQPQVTHQDIISKIVGLVQQGLMDPEQGDQLVKQIPGNPARLRDYLTQKGLEVMDASKRMDMLTPKFEKTDLGGTVGMGTVNQMTGQFTPGQSFQKSVTPDVVLSANTTRRGQDMTQSTADKNREMSNLQVEQTPTGVVVIDKKTRAAVPVIGPNGQVQQVKSPAWEAMKRSDQLAASVAEARKLLPGATGSGMGALVDRGAAFVGEATTGGEQAAQLKTIAGWMTSNVPRMEGPQSNADTKLYREMAADVGDDTKPVSVRLKALDTLESLQKKYTDAATGTNLATKSTGARPPLSAFRR